MTRPLRVEFEGAVYHVMGKRYTERRYQKIPEGFRLPEWTKHHLSVMLKVDRRGHLRVPRARREVLLDEFERCGVSAAEFAAHIGVKYTTFCHWKRSRELDRARQAAASTEVEVVRIAEPVISGNKLARRGPWGLVMVTG